MEFLRVRSDDTNDFKSVAASKYYSLEIRCMKSLSTRYIFYERPLSCLASIAILWMPIYLHCLFLLRGLACARIYFNVA